MIGLDEIREIISVYSRHGWILSRVLLSGPLSVALTAGQKTTLFGVASVSDADFDAAWFKRNRGDGFTAWEIRLLSKTPYALCESLPDSLSTEEIEAAKIKMEKRLRNLAS